MYLNNHFHNKCYPKKLLHKKYSKLLHFFWKHPNFYWKPTPESSLKTTVLPMKIKFQHLKLQHTCGTHR